MPNKTRIMVVDDSAVIRGLVTRALKEVAEFDVVASASNGAMAVAALKPGMVDVVLLDIEMPEMDGITALPKLLEVDPNVRVMMVSTLTTRNAEITLRALALGAVECVAKPSTRDNADEVNRFYQELILKINGLATSRRAPVAGSAALTPAPTHSLVQKPLVLAASKLTPKPTAEPSRPQGKIGFPLHEIRAVAIASSTGGPQALSAVFGALKGKIQRQPIFITQHMPATFTTILAEQLGKTASMPCAEGKQGDVVEPGKIYIAPGDYHMLAEKNGDGKITIATNQKPPVNFCRPAADPMLESLAEIYKQHLLVLVLTGMGSDGCEGARVAVAKGATCIAQNEETCVVWGMPRAVTEADLCKAVLPLSEIAPYMLRACGVTP